MTLATTDDNPCNQVTLAGILADSSEMSLNKKLINNKVFKIYINPDKGDDNCCSDP